MHLTFLALGISASMLNLAPSTSIVRGYNETFSFNFAITDEDQIIDVDQVTGESANFLITLVLSSSDIRVTFPESHSISITPNISLGQVQQKIHPNSSVMISGRGTVLIPRIGCTMYQYLCVILHPGPDSSIQLLEGSFDHIDCIQTSDYTNCQGKVWLMPAHIMYKTISLFFFFQT